MRIIAVHLLNNYSGSPKVLMQLLKCWTKNSFETHLYTCGGEGFLSNIHKVNNHFYWYRFAKNPLIRLLFLTTSQLFLAVQLLFFLKKKDILYINTVLPFGAALIGKIIGCKVLYHIHETGVKPKILNHFLFAIVKWCATDVVYVSHFLAEKQPVKVKNNVLYNVIEENFRNEAKLHLGKAKEAKIILMISSLKIYKGVNEFVKLAELCPHYIFKLVVNANQKEIDSYFKTVFLPQNLILYTSQTDVHPFYKEASIVVNLTVTKLCKETFGLTILEAMTYGIPTIVPPIGGMTELVENNKNGFFIDSQELILISEKINQLFQNPLLYHQMSQSAVIKSRFFSEHYFEKESIKIISN
ncbi:glycosyltransferase family 4 protein [Flavobacterium sp. Sr18]|uniref:glycosyltransferase family 4 protein n=1 Tax=Flavobacterium sp. Sr18 TaxID=935222 RepID=UPI0013E51A6A|nr:glycosyltransferase family 4 protein [Flavobacterium sp. Sr18]QIH40028.1 glycosyltransferase family 4 protein [Flavobacterium sp. Sr18]